MAKRFGNRWIDSILLILLGLGLLAAYQHRYAAGDWIFLRRYSPPPEITNLADDAGLSQQGRRLLYRGDPEIVNVKRLDAECQAENVGCITPDGRIFLLDFKGAKTYNDTLVTAAHEMLHLAWRRLGKRERQRLSGLEDQAVANLHDSDLNQRLDAYTDPEERHDEAHSILGSEYAQVGDELEQHYKLYFADRTKTTSAFRKSQ